MESKFFITIYFTEWGCVFSISAGESIPHEDFLLFVGRIPEVFTENKLLLRRHDLALFFVPDTGSVVRRIIRDANQSDIPVVYQEYFK